MYYICCNIFHDNGTPFAIQCTCLFASNRHQLSSSISISIDKFESLFYIHLLRFLETTSLLCVPSLISSSSSSPSPSSTLSRFMLLRTISLLL
mmetsp:Transcript_10857/g.10514  ORF Transcript_10857/g.10514 Transcript_10857/m.10514 type:complete len:93 (-) Transcript_10857:34-312(-)